MAAAPVWVYYVAIAASTVATIQQQRASTKAQEIQNLIQARGEKADSQNREIARKKRLIATIAAANVQGGVGGIAAGEGSSANIIAQNVADEGFEDLSDQAGTALRLQALATDTKSAKQSLKLGAAVTLFDAGFKAGGIGKPPKK